MKKEITLYHGSHRKIDKAESDRCMYFSPDIDVAKEYALGLDDLGNYNNESWIYSIKINIDEVEVEEDFLYFDCMGYQDYEEMPEITYNEECDYYCIKKVEKLKLVEQYENQL